MGGCAMSTVAECVSEFSQVQWVVVDSSHDASIYRFPSMLQADLCAVAGGVPCPDQSADGLRGPLLDLSGPGQASSSRLGPRRLRGDSWALVRPHPNRSLADRDSGRVSGSLSLSKHGVLWFGTLAL